MKISIECEVEGRVRIRESIVTRIGSKEYTLTPDGVGWLKTITITKNVNRPEKYSRKIERNLRTNEKIIRIHQDIDEYYELLGDFQELESVLSYETHGSLKNIAWDSRNEIWIPETNEKEKSIQITGLKINKPEALEKILTAERFMQLISTKCKYSSLIILKAFFREGLNEFYSARYINAFYNFYFILEDVYCNGKHRFNKVTQLLNNSSEFTGIVNMMISKEMGEEKYFKNIQKLCAEENEKYDVTGLIRLIVKIRGRLHHFSSKNSKRTGTPFTHDIFEGITFLLMALAYHTIENKVKEIDRND